MSIELLKECKEYLEGCFESDGGELEAQGSIDAKALVRKIEAYEAAKASGQPDDWLREFTGWLNREYPNFPHYGITYGHLKDCWKTAWNRSPKRESFEEKAADRARAIERYQSLRDKIDGWQPIETAPKNEDILLFHPKLAGTYSNFFVGRNPEKYKGFDNECTYWMPLPKPPTNEIEDGGSNGSV